MRILRIGEKAAAAAKILLNNRQQSPTFSIDLIAIRFKSLVDKISKLSTLAQEFGPQDGINNENFLESIKKIYSEMIAL